MRESDKTCQNPGGIDRAELDAADKRPGGRDTGRAVHEAAIQPAEKESGTQTPASGITSKQVAAIAGIVLLVLLYVIALIAAVADTSSSGRLFLLCLFATVAIPILIWIYTWMYGKLKGRHTFADFRTKEQEEQLQALADPTRAQAGQQADSPDPDKTTEP